MSVRRWLLPRSVDVLAILRAQAAITVQGMEAFVGWAAGDAGAGDEVRRCEHMADDRKRELRTALIEALSTPLEPEDLYRLSQDLDAILNRAKDLIREAEVMDCAPDEPILAMAGELLAGTRELETALGVLPGHDARRVAPAAADRAIRHQRRLEHIYRTAMSALLASDDLRDVTARRELYRRAVRTSDHLVALAERVWYAVLKAS